MHKGAVLPDMAAQNADTCLIPSQLVADAQNLQPKLQGPYLTASPVPCAYHVEKA